LFFNATELDEAVLLPQKPIDEKDVLSLSRCAYPDRSGKRSYFIVNARDILPRSPEDLRAQTIRLGNYY